MILSPPPCSPVMPHSAGDGAHLALQLCYMSLDMEKPCPKAWCSLEMCSSCGSCRDTGMVWGRWGIGETTFSLPCGSNPSTAPPLSAQLHLWLGCFSPGAAPAADISLLSSVFWGQDWRRPCVSERQYVSYHQSKARRLSWMRNGGFQDQARAAPAIKDSNCPSVI